MTENEFPQGWNEGRVRDVLAHYEKQSDEAALAEDEDRLKTPTRTVMEVPSELVPAIRELISKRKAV